MGELAQLKNQAKEYNILCVEDDIILRGQIETFLKKLFKNTYSACDGLEGIEMFQKHSPDIVVSDLSMPNMNGFELIKELKQIKPSVQIIIISAHNDQNVLLNAIHIGVCDFVPKPISMGGLQNALEKAIDTLKLIYKKELHREIEDTQESHKNEAINELMRVKKSGNDIQLINHYRGVPIIHTGFIDKIEDEQLIITTTYPQIMASKYEQNITITSELLAHDIEAKYVKSDFFKSVIVVNNLAFSQTTAKKRQQIRVEVDDGFYINLTNSKNQKTIAQAIDISNKAIYVELLDFSGDISDGESFKLELLLQNRQIKSDIKVYRIIKKEIETDIHDKSHLTHRTFVVFFLDFNSEDLETLHKYIYERQLELLAEFRGIEC